MNSARAPGNVYCSAKGTCSALTVAGTITPQGCAPLPPRTRQNIDFIKFNSFLPCHGKTLRGRLSHRRRLYAADRKNLPPAMREPPPHAARRASPRECVRTGQMWRRLNQKGSTHQSVWRQPSNPPRAPTHAWVNGAVMKCSFRRRQFHTGRRRWPRAT